jgi:hypothetical protein
MKKTIELNNKLNLQAYLNELYHEAERLINQIQGEIDKISVSTSLTNTTIEEKSDYAKAINALITSKSNALKLKLDVQKIATEILKFGGDETGALNAINKNKTVNNKALNIKDIQSILMNNKQAENTNEPPESEKVIYKVKKTI